MKYCKYQVRSGVYEGMWHVRQYLGNGKYFHIGRYKTQAEANKAIQNTATL